MSGRSLPGDAAVRRRRVQLRGLRKDLHRPGRCSSAGSPEIHADGEIWAQTPWDLRSALIAAHGAAGITRVRALVTDGLRLSPANPSLLDMRNAILQADINRGFRDCGRIWAAFAARGMGLNAQPAGDNDTAPVEGFTAPPPACPPPARDTTAIGKWALHGGRHRATISARDAAGNRSKRRYASFAILRR